MATSLQDRVDRVETKTDSLEAVLGQFISSTNKMVLRLENDTKKFREEVRADAKKFGEEIRSDTKKFKEGVRSDTKKLKNEMKDFKDEMRRSSKKMDKKWGDLTNKMGTLVEDMVAPNIPTIAREYFGDDDFEFFGLRVRKRNVKNRSIRREFDIIAASDDTFFINETKSKPSPEDVKAFSEMLKDILDYFPENKGKKMIPIFSSMYLPDDLQKNLTRRGIYAMGAKGGTMDLLNFEQVSERR